MTDQESMAAAVRRLMLATGLTTVDSPELAKAHDLVVEATRLLARSTTRRVDRLSYLEPSLARAAGDGFTYAASNPATFPVAVTFDGDSLRGTVTIDELFEGPPDSVHGGTIAWLFDSILGLIVQASLKPSVTGTLTVRYLRRTPLHHPVQFGARIVDQTARKTYLEAWIEHAGARTAEATAIFIEVPRNEHMD